MYVLKKAYMNHFGLDLKSSDLTRPTQYASSMRNAQYKESGGIEKRPGYQAHAASMGGHGLWTYERFNPITGASEREVLAVDQNLYRLKETTLTVTYAGADPTALISFYVDSASSTYKCQVIVGTTELLNFDLGIGFDTGSPVTTAQLLTQLNALTDITASATGSTTTPAAFFEIVRTHDLSSSTGSALSLVARYWEQVNSTVSNPLSAYYAQRNASDAENVSATQIQNTMYFGSGYSDTMKYDGQTFYRAGLPNVATLTSAVGGAGAITGNNYQHRARYIQYDDSGNIIEGNLKSVATTVNAAAQSIDVTVANVLAGSGFNTNCAIVNGAQVTVNTITVDNGSGGSHTMQVGDTAYFFDAVSASYVTRSVTAIGATTITVSGAAVTVADNAVISNNLRIGIYRNKTSAVTPTVHYTVVEVPNNSFAATQVVNDNLADASLGALLIPPVTDRSPPIKGKYVSQWNGIMMIGGNIEDPLLLAWSDVDGPEYFPSDTNQIYIESGAQDKISGLAPNNEVFTVHGDSSFTVINGDILSGQIRVETKARDSGCSAHASIQEIDGVLVWLTPQGPRFSQGGQVPQPLGPAVDPSNQQAASRIDPAFDNTGKQEIEKLKLKRAVGIADRIGQRYIMFVPAESANSGNVYANSNSRIFVYDKTRDSWLEWKNFNSAGGMCLFGDEFFFSERRLSTFSGSISSILYRRHNLDDAWDYADNVAAVDFDYAPQWEALDEPSVLKKFTRLRVFSLEETPNNSFSLTVDQECNYQIDVSAAQFELDFSGDGYGVSAYGDAPYGDPSEGKVDHTLNRDRIRSTRTRFSNDTLHENVLITGWELEVATTHRPKLTP